MATESIISATFGVPGSGKTYSRVRFLVEDFLINNPDGLYITNIPLNIETISKHVSELLNHRSDSSVSPEDIAARLIIIPDEVLCDWEKLNQLENKDLTVFDSSTFPPTQYLQQFRLQNSHIAIDEFHKYFTRKGPRMLRKLWNDWFAEIRKTGCVFEAITQSYGQMSDEFLDKCATRLELVNHSELRDPLFHIRMGDWYELRAGLFKRLPLQRITEKETMRGTSTSGSVVWKPTGRVKSYTLDPFFFQFYNSFRNYSGSSSERKSPSQIYGRKIIFWFLRRNFLEIVSRFIIVGVIAWFLLGGGMQFCMMSIFRIFGYVGGSNGSKIVDTNSINKKQVHHVSSAVSQPITSVSPVKSDKANHNKNSVSKNDLDKLKVEDPEQKLNQKDLDPFRPSLFWDDKVFLKCGIQISMGYKFNGGILNGKTVKRIDKKNRLIQLDDDTILYMFAVGQ